MDFKDIIIAYDIQPVRCGFGSIVRMGPGSTNLMRITYTSVGHGGPGKHRYYGDHCCGGYTAAYWDKVTQVTEEDLKMWDKCAHYRTHRIIKDHSIVGMVED